MPTPATPASEFGKSPRHGEQSPGGLSNASSVQPYVEGRIDIRHSEYQRSKGIVEKRNIQHAREANEKFKKQRRKLMKDGRGDEVGEVASEYTHEVLITAQTPTRLQELIQLKRDKKLAQPCMTILLPSNANSCLNLINAWPFFAGPDTEFMPMHEDRARAKRLWNDRREICFDKHFCGHEWKVEIVDRIDKITDW